MDNLQTQARRFLLGKLVRPKTAPAGAESEPTPQKDGRAMAPSGPFETWTKARILRAICHERRKSRSGSPDYDFNRHFGLHLALANKKRAR